MLKFRPAVIDDLELYFNWANDELVRKSSINTEPIEFDKHVKWFTSKINNPNVHMYVFLDVELTPVGQVIIDKKDDWVFVGQSVAKEHRGKKYSVEMLTKSTNDFLKKHPKDTIISVVKASNIASLKMAAKSGFNVLELNNEQNNNLVIKGLNQNDESTIEAAKKFYDL